jgi:hypothetical protein
MEATSDQPSPVEEQKAEPRWDAAVALLAAGGLHLVLAPNLELGPAWLPLACVLVLEVAVYASIQTGKEPVARMLGHATSAVLTFFLVVSVCLLVGTVLHHGEPIVLLKSAAALWIVNIIVFATWYWRLDAGGPDERGKRPGHRKGSFYFPQMSMPDEIKKATCMDDWSPGFFDYLFLAFCTSTALSPADTGALTRWAKVLIMTQSLISLTVIVLLAARAVNTL